MPHTLGSLLHPSDRQHVLDSFMYRMTFESAKRWPQATEWMIKGGFRMTLIADEQWLGSTTFTVRQSDRRLDQRVTTCEHNHSKYRSVLA